MGYIYQIVDTTTHEYYIGKRQNTNPNTDGYWGSGYNRICRSAKKHNGANGRYRKDILINGVRNEKLGKLEEIIIGDRYETDSLCLNKIAGGTGGAAKGNTNGRGGKGKVISQKTKDKIAAALKGVPKSDEHKANLSAAMMGTKMGNKNSLGAVRTTATKDKTSAALKGNKNCLGRVLSQATKDKISAANKGKNKGKVRTDEQNAAMSDAMKESWRLRKLKENN